MAAADRAPKTPEPAPEAVSRHQVDAMARILGLNPDDVVSIHAEATHVDVALFVLPENGRGRLLTRRHYTVER